MAQKSDLLHDLDKMITEDVEAVAILYYLEEKNPKVPEKDLSRNLKINESDVFAKIKLLKRLDLVTDELPNKYTLTSRGRAIVSELHKVTKD